MFDLHFQKVILTLSAGTHCTGIGQTALTGMGMNRFSLLCGSEAGGILC